MQEQENSVLKSMKLKVVGTENFLLWSKNGLSCKKINFEQSQLLLKLFKITFNMDQNWTRLKFVTEMHKPGSQQLESCP